MLTLGHSVLTNVNNCSNVNLMTLGQIDVRTLCSNVNMMTLGHIAIGTI